MQDLKSKQFLEGGTFKGKKKKKTDKTRRKKISGPRMNLEETCVRTALSLGF